MSSLASAGPLLGPKAELASFCALGRKGVGAEGEHVAGDGVLQILGDIPMADLLALRSDEDRRDVIDAPGWARAPMLSSLTWRFGS